MKVQFSPQSPEWFRQFAVRLNKYLANLDSTTTSLTAAGINAPDLSDESDATYWYYGWENIDGGWLVQRQTRSSGMSLDADSGYADLATAWPNKDTLSYS